MTDAIRSRNGEAPPSGNSGEMLSIDRVSMSYTDKGPSVLQNFDLKVSKGEFVSLLGPSGCGKTTALRIVAGLLSPTHGKVSINGLPSRGPSPDKSIVFQHFNLFPWRTALSNVAYGLEIQGRPRGERLERARELLELVGLGAHAAHYPSELSGGQQQRIGLARALAIQPDLLLMDEPFGALDALTREYLQVLLQRICAERDLTVLFVTHSIDEAIFLSDRIVVMGVNPGRVIAELSVDLRRPRTDYNFRAEPSYADLRNGLWSLLEQQISSVEDNVT